MKQLTKEKLSGIYTYKIYRCKSKMPWILQKLLPEEAFELHEESWNAYPYCKTVLTLATRPLQNPGYMGEDSMLVIESIHLPDNGSSENPLNINRKRDIVFLDICDDTLIGEANYRPESDPKIFKSERTGRGQLREDWMEHTTPMMCCYKAVTVQFKWLGLGSLVEKTIMKQYSKIFSNFHRHAFCWIDTWFDLTDEELQEYDEETARQLQELVNSEKRRGVALDD
ncbi:phosphatidylinositol transfer protein [Cooperia oncophora]